MVPSFAILRGRSLDNLFETKMRPPTSVTIAIMVFGEKVAAFVINLNSWKSPCDRPKSVIDVLPHRHSLDETTK
jgi:hypothetical protein